MSGQGDYIAALVDGGAMGERKVILNFLRLMARSLEQDAEVETHPAVAYILRRDRALLQALAEELGAGGHHDGERIRAVSTPAFKHFDKGRHDALEEAARLIEQEQAGAGLAMRIRALKDARKTSAKKDEAPSVAADEASGTTTESRANGESRTPKDG